MIIWGQSHHKLGSLEYHHLKFTRPTCASRGDTLATPGDGDPSTPDGDGREGIIIWSRCIITTRSLWSVIAWDRRSIIIGSACDYATRIHLR